MPDDDWALGQNTVDVRNEARREYQRAGAYVCHDPEGDWIRDQQTAICTSDPECKAAADEHNPDCPIEQELAAAFGF